MEPRLRCAAADGVMRGVALDGVAGSVSEGRSGVCWCFLDGLGVVRDLRRRWWPGGPGGVDGLAVLVQATGEVSRRGAASGRLFSEARASASEGRIGEEAVVWRRGGGALALVLRAVRVDMMESLAQGLAVSALSSSSSMSMAAGVVATVTACDGGSDVRVMCGVLRRCIDGRRWCEPADA